MKKKKKEEVEEEAQKQEYRRRRKRRGREGGLGKIRRRQLGKNEQRTIWQRQHDMFRPSHLEKRGKQYWAQF